MTAVEENEDVYIAVQVQSPLYIKFTLQDTMFKQRTDTKFENHLPPLGLNISDMRASGMYFLIRLLSKACIYLIQCGERKVMSQLI